MHPHEKCYIHVMYRTTLHMLMYECKYIQKNWYAHPHKVASGYSKQASHIEIWIGVQQVQKPCQL